MNNTPAMAYAYSSRVGKIIFRAMEEILGYNGVNAMLNQASLPVGLPSPLTQTKPLQPITFSELGRMHAALRDFYGPHGGRGVALRIGRACFQQGLQEYGARRLGALNPDFRFTPLKKRIDDGMSALAGIFNRLTGQKVTLEDRKTALAWKMEACALCGGRETDEVACHMAVGFLQEALYWLSHGRTYQVEEVQCIAAGDSSCTLLIHKTPMG